MCRLLAVIARTPIDVRYHLDAFTRVCTSSAEYQGHGWGYSVLRDGEWERYRSLTPIWDDGSRPVGDVRVLLAHARSAFRDEGIVVENNMPFIDGQQAFIFNGELQGVRLPVDGRTGAERLFRFLRRPAASHTPEAVSHALGILKSRTTNIRACNFIIADRTAVIVHSLFAGEAAYFTLHHHRTDDALAICSAPYDDGDPRWAPMQQDHVEIVPCFF